MSTVEPEIRLQSRMSRRTVVGTGAKLAYAAPLVAATFSLAARGAGAAVCDPGFTFIAILGQCCICDCSTIGDEIDPATGTCHNPDGTDVTEFCRTCVGVSGPSIPV